MNNSITLNRYFATLYFLVTTLGEALKKNGRVVSGLLMQEALKKNQNHPYVKKLKTKKATLKFNGDKSNINAICDFDEKEQAAVLPLPIFDILEKTELKMGEDGEWELVFNSTEDAEKFSEWKLQSQLNKKIYNNKYSIINKIITELKKSGIIRELPKGVGNKPNHLGKGSTGCNSRIFDYVGEKTDRVYNNRHYIHFEDVFNSDLTKKTNHIDNIYNKINKSEILEVARKNNIENANEENIKKQIQEIIQKV